MEAAYFIKDLAVGIVVGQSGQFLGHLEELKMKVHYKIKYFFSKVIKYTFSLFHGEIKTVQKYMFIIIIAIYTGDVIIM